ncbi:MAG: phosphatidylserine decarboxylase [Thermoplasmata archaeon]
MFAKDGIPLLVSLFTGCIVALLGGFLFASQLLIGICFFFLALFMFFAYFFRDPERNCGEGIVSPADGVVTDVKKSGGQWFISVFMNVHDVHVNRAPEEGKIVRVNHFSGRHRIAFGKRNAENEHTVIEIESKHGKIRVVQIAGIFARRIHTYVREGMFVKKGERIGIIFLGSRVNLYLPENVVIDVKKGMRVRAGETSVGEWKDDVD